MIKVSIPFLLLAVLCAKLSFCQSVIPQEAPSAVIPDFSLRSIDNQYFNTKEIPSAKGLIVVFTCNHCPFAKLYTQRLNKLYDDYAKRGVILVAINSMDTMLYADEGFIYMQKRAVQQKYHFPYLQDSEQNIVKLFSAAHTPQAFILWKEALGWVVKYNGPIDNNGEQPHLATPYVANITDSLLDHQLVLPRTIPSFGCRIFLRNP